MHRKGGVRQLVCRYANYAFIEGVAVKAFKRQFGKLLAARRLEMGFKTQRSLAEALETESSQVNRWENGKFSPDDYYFDKILKILEVDEAYFVEPAAVEPLSAEAIYDYVRSLEDQLAARGSRVSSPTRPYHTPKK